MSGKEQRQRLGPDKPFEALGSEAGWGAAGGGSWVRARVLLEDRCVYFAGEKS